MRRRQTPASRPIPINRLHQLPQTVHRPIDVMLVLLIVFMIAHAIAAHRRDQLLQRRQPLTPSQADPIEVTVKADGCCRCVMVAAPPWQAHPRHAGGCWSCKGRKTARWSSRPTRKRQIRRSGPVCLAPHAQGVKRGVWSPKKARAPPMSNNNEGLKTGRIGATVVHVRRLGLAFSVRWKQVTQLPVAVGAGVRALRRRRCRPWLNRHHPHRLRPPPPPNLHRHHQSSSRRPPPPPNRTARHRRRAARREAKRTLTKAAEAGRKRRSRTPQSSCRRWDTAKKQE